MIAVTSGKDKINIMKKPKVIAFFLPQYHEIPENNEWWGKGFTDWVSARKSQPMFPGHYQPRLPAHDNYYNLLDKNTMVWQAKLARKFGIYGFCIYHYWFGDKQLLEKPAENLLRWKDININYCFSWANESWIASWSKIKGNAWTNLDARKNAMGDDYLAKQTYGGEEEWKRHFEYLLPFFRDERYIKKDGKPVFVIYKPEDVKAFGIMKTYWNKLAVDNGLKGIFFIGTNCKKWKQKKYDAALLYEPSYTMRDENNDWYYKGFWFLKVREWLKKKGILVPRLCKYGVFWQKILERNNGNGIFPGAFVDFDASPRKGKDAIIFQGANPKRFGTYFKKFINRNADKEYIFITAWNEWGEGACLEPDKKYGVQYLNAVKKSIKGDCC